MKLFVPELGTKLELTTKWQFPLYPENRNETLAKVLGYDLKYLGHVEYEGEFDWLKHHIWIKDGEEDTTTIPVELPKGTVLTVDRIYIRKGAKNFSSISFFIKGMEKVTTKAKYHFHNPQARPVRFWARLDDCNNINFKIK